jgi:hypothetical protein
VVIYWTGYVVGIIKLINICCAENMECVNILCNFIERNVLWEVKKKYLCDEGKIWIVIKLCGNLLNDMCCENYKRNECVLNGKFGVC